MKGIAYDPFLFSQSLYDFAMIHILIDDSFSITHSNISVLAGQDLAQILGQNGYLILIKRISKHVSSQ